MADTRSKADQVSGEIGALWTEHFPNPNATLTRVEFDRILDKFIPEYLALNDAKISPKYLKVFMRPDIHHNDVLEITTFSEFVAFQDILKRKVAIGTFLYYLSQRIRDEV